MKLSIVSTEVDACLSELKPPSTSFSQTRSFILWKSHKYTEAKQFNGSTLWKHILLFTHCRACSRTRRYRVILSHAINCISSLTDRNFPVSFYEKKKTTKFLTCCVQVSSFYCISWVQLTLSPGYGLFHLHFITSTSQYFTGLSRVKYFINPEKCFALEGLINPPGSSFVSQWLTEEIKLA